MLIYYGLKISGIRILTSLTAVDVIKGVNINA